MASHSYASDGHLDATGDREVVYCHACANEWYRDNHGLTCPRCQGDIIEIVSPDNDPRDLDDDDHPSASTSPEIRPRNYHNDSDPDEADIEEHLRGEHGFVFNRDTRQGPHRRHHSPEMEPVFTRFLDMINGFGPAQDPGGNAGHNHQPHPLFPHDDVDDFDLPPHHHHHQSVFAAPPRVHRTTFQSGPLGGGTASITIFSGPVRTRGNMSQMDGRGGDPFQEIFSNVLRDVGPPGADNGAGGGHPPAFIRSLHDIIGLLNPANAMAGDAVYSQEALDRIISNLMEANPQSNAAPPATDEALKKLERKPVNKEMLAHESKTECSICIDDIKEGDMALFLPCKHWFHENCVVMWLKEHNTCPICRTPIEKNDGGENNEHRDGPQSGMPRNNPGGPGASFSGAFPDSSADGGSGSSQPGTSRWFSASFGGSQRGVGAAGDNNSSGSILHPTQSSRPPSHRHSRLNEALRSVSSMQERQREREREQGSSSSVSYDTSRMQRRNSMSPTSPRGTAPGEYGSRIRHRSPSQSSGRWEASDSESSQSQRQSGHGPLSWIRDRFGGGGSNNNSSRGGRRP